MSFLVLDIVEKQGVLITMSFLQIQPDLITLDPSFVGSLAPPSKLTTSVDGNPVTDVPYARLPRIDRLRVSGKVDVTEEGSDGDEDEDGTVGESKKKDREEREKRRMRGKGKSLKRYLRKQRKNVIDPKAVRLIPFLAGVCLLIHINSGCHTRETGKGEDGEEEGTGGCEGRDQWRGCAEKEAFGAGQIQEITMSALIVFCADGSASHLVCSAHDI